MGECACEVVNKTSVWGGSSLRRPFHIKGSCWVGGCACEPIIQEDSRAASVNQ